MKQVDFENGSTFSNIVQTAIPMLVAQILSLLYNVVDRIYISRIPGSGTVALGAVGLCFPIIIIVTAFTNLYGGGGAPLFSIARGRKDRKTAERMMNLSFLLEIVTALVLIVIILIFGESVLCLFGTDAEAMTYALPYLRIYILGTGFTMVATGMNPFINAQGYPGIGMMTVTIGAVSNIVLDPVFIFAFGLGTSGAAIATVISQALSALFVFHFLRSKKPEYRLNILPLSALRKYQKDVKSITALGTASFVMQVTNSIVQIACNRVLADIGGHTYISIMTIVSSVRQILETPAFAIAEGTSPIISYNYGAGRYKRVKAAIRLMFFMLMAYTGTAWLAVIFRSGILVSIFNTDHALTDGAVRALNLYFFAFIFMTLQHTGQTVFKSLNKKKRAIFFSLFRKVIIVVPLTFALPCLLHMGTDGVFTAEPISNVIGGTASFVTMLVTIMPELKHGMEERTAV